MKSCEEVSRSQKGAREFCHKTTWHLLVPHLRYFFCDLVAQKSHFGTFCCLKNGHLNSCEISYGYGCRNSQAL